MFLLDHITDIILILVSSLAALYCFLLNKRLRSLQNLETGVGASIVSLTDAITRTSKAAKDAQAATAGNIKTLETLLRDAESAAPKIEALSVKLVRAVAASQQQHTAMQALSEDLNTKLSDALPSAIDEAQSTASSLLKVVAVINAYSDKLPRDPQPVRSRAPHRATANAANTTNTADATRA